MRIHFKQIDSTSTYIKDNYQKLKHLTFVDASFQTNGRGRMNRSWFGDKNSLMFSYLIKDKSLVKEYASISILTAVSVIKCLEGLNINDVTLKWPNDVYIKGKKAAGILLEGISISDNMEAFVVGVGLNVTHKSFPEEIIDKATSIKQHRRFIFKRQIRRRLYKQILKDIYAFLDGDHSYIDFANSHNFLLNKAVFAEINGKKEEIIALNINKDNSLSIKKDGAISSIFSSEITFH